MTRNCLCDNLNVKLKIRTKEKERKYLNWRTFNIFSNFNGYVYNDNKHNETHLK